MPDTEISVAHNRFPLGQLTGRSLGAAFVTKMARDGILGEKLLLGMSEALQEGIEHCASEEYSLPGVFAVLASSSVGRLLIQETLQKLGPGHEHELANLTLGISPWHHAGFYPWTLLEGARSSSFLLEATKLPLEIMKVWLAESIQALNKEGWAARWASDMRAEVRALETSFLTFNVFALPPCTLQRCSDKERYQRIAEKLVNSGVDNIALQELWDQRCAEIISRELRRAEYNIFDGAKPHGLRGNDGLLIASRYPIQRSAILPFVHRHLEERVVAKGAAYAEIDAPGFGTVGVANSHLVARPATFFRWTPSEAPRHEIRRQQLMELGPFFERVHPTGKPLFSLLDANMHEGVRNDQLLSEVGGVDLARFRFPRPPENRAFQVDSAEIEGCTLDPKQNPMVRDRRHPSERLDRVLVRGWHGSNSTLMVRRVFQQPVLSDHFGLEIRLRTYPPGINPALVN